MTALAQRGRMADADFRHAIADAVARHDLSDIIGRDVKLHRAGRGVKGLCPFHRERSPSFYVYDADGHYFCFGCQAGGDAIDYLRETRGLSFRQALEWLGGADLPIISPVERERRESEAIARRRRDIADAQAFWESGLDPRGTPAEIYLRDVRGITMTLPPSIRYGRVPAARDPETDEWTSFGPAVLCAIHDREEEVCGLQRIFVRKDGAGKAAMRKPKLSLGRVSGAAMRLGPVRPTVIVCEGPEDGLSLAQEIPDCSVWVTLGTGLMPLVEYPPEVSEIVIAGQNDGPGRVAVEKAGDALLQQGFAVRTMFPDPVFKDWNGQLLGVAQ